MIYKKNFPEKYKAKCLSGHLKSKVAGNHLHHWSYCESDAKDLIELEMKEHYKLHRFIIYDQEFFKYRRIDTMELLDTKESHIAYYESLKDKP